jgi:HEPN domain-containing protein
MAAPNRLQRAKRELTRAQRDASADDTEATLQHACQSIEAALKAIIAYEGRTVPTGQRGQDYRYLQSVSAADLDAHTDVIDELTGVYDRARYVDTPSSGVTDLERVLDGVESVVSFAANISIPIPKLTLTHDSRPLPRVDRDPRSRGSRRC